MGRPAVSGDGYLTIAEFANRYGCTERTIRRRIAAGLIKVFRDGGIVRIHETELQRLRVQNSSGGDSYPSVPVRRK